MTSRQKTFSLGLSREMIPVARIVVFYIKEPEEVVTDVLNFFVNGTKHNMVTFNVFKLVRRIRLFIFNKSIYPIFLAQPLLSFL